MGFLGKIFGASPKSPVPRKKVSVSFDGFEGFIEKESKPLFESLEKEVFSKFSEIKHLLSEISLLLGQLKAKKIDSWKGNNRLRKIVATSKRNVLNQLSLLVKKLSPPESHEFEAIRSYSLNGQKTLDAEARVFGKNIAYTGIILKEEIRDIGKVFNELKKCFVGLEKTFKQNSNLSLLSESRKHFNEMDSVKKEVALLESGLPSHKNELSLLNKELKSKQDELGQLKKEPDFSLLERSAQKKSELLKKKNELKTKLLEFLSPIDKPLKRFNKLVKAKQFILDEKQKTLLDSYTFNPFLAMKKDPNALVLKSLLSDLEGLVKNRTIELKEKERGKKISALNELLSFDFFENVFWEFNKIESEMKELERSKKESPVLKRIGSLEKSLLETEKQLTEQQDVLEEQLKRIKSLNQEFTEKSAFLEKTASDLLDKNVSLEPEKKP